MMKYRQVMMHNLMTYRTHRSHVHRRGQIKTMTKIKKRMNSIIKGLVPFKIHWRRTMTIWYARENRETNPIPTKKQYRMIHLRSESTTTNQTN